MERTYDDALLLSVMIEEGADLLVDQQRQGKKCGCCAQRFFWCGPFLDRRMQSDSESRWLEETEFFGG